MQNGDEFNILFITSSLSSCISFKISNLHICLCSFNLACPTLEKENYKKMCIFYCLVLLNSVLF